MGGDYVPRPTLLFIESNSEKRNVRWCYFEKYAVQGGCSISLVDGMTATVRQRNIRFIPFANRLIRHSEFKLV